MCGSFKAVAMVCYIGPAVCGAHEVELADLTLNTLYSLYEPGEYP